MPEATVVKAFNTVYFRRLLEESRVELPAEERLAVPVAGDDADAKRIVIDLIDQIGFTGVDAGSLAESRRQQPGTLSVPGVRQEPAAPDAAQSGTASRPPRRLIADSVLAAAPISETRRRPCGAHRDP